jgi:hypothetical protein
MPRFIRTIEVEAIQYSAGSKEIAEFLGDAMVRERCTPQTGCLVYIDNGIGDPITARHGDWIIKAHGMFHAMPDHQFQREFRPAPAIAAQSRV